MAGTSNIKPDFKMKGFNEVLINGWHKVINFWLCALIFLLSLVIFPASYRIYDPVTKRFFLQIITLIFLTIWIIRIIWTGRFSWVKSPLNLPLFIFGLTAILSTVFSINQHLSFYGFYSESEGLLILLNYLLLPVVVINFVHRSEDIQRIIKVILVSGAIVALYGFAQHFGWGIIFTKPELQAKASLRAFSVLGNPVYLASYLVLILPIAISLFLTTFLKDKSRKNPDLLRRKRWFYGLTIILLFGCLLITYSRGGWVAFFIAFLFLGWLNQETFIKNKKPLVLLVVFFIIITVIFNISGKLKGESSIIERAASTTELEAGTVATRFVMWEAVVKMIADRPIFGWGLETLQLKFPQYSSPKLYKLEEYRLLSRAHNELLQIAVTMGLLGLGAYLWLLFVFFKWGIRFQRQLNESPEKALFGGIIAGGAGYLIQMQFNLGVIATNSLFWILIGLVMTMGRIYSESKFPFIIKTWQLSKEKAIDRLSGQPIRIFFLFMTIPVFVLLFILAFRPLLAGYFAGQGEIYFQNRQWPKAFDYYNRAININSKEEHYYMELGNKYYSLAIFSKDSREQSSLLQQALVSYNESAKIDPLSFASHFNLGNAYYYLGSSGDTNAWPKAINSYKKAVSIDPNYVRGYIYLADAYKGSGDRRKAIQTLKKALKIDFENKEINEAIDNLQKEE